MKYTLVPSSFFKAEESCKLLSQVVQLGENDKVRYQELPDYQAVLVYATTSESQAPAIAAMLRAISSLHEHNKVLVCYDGTQVSVAIATGNRLLLANSYPAADYVTGEYFIFAALKRLQINPEQTVIYFYGEAPFRMKNDMFRYCKGVETL